MCFFSCSYSLSLSDVIKQETHTQYGFTRKIYFTIKNQEEYYWRHPLHFTGYISTVMEKFLHWWCNLIMYLYIYMFQKHVFVMSDYDVLMLLRAFMWWHFFCVRHSSTMGDELKWDSCLKMQAGTGWWKNGRGGRRRKKLEDRRNADCSVDKGRKRVVRRDWQQTKTGSRRPNICPTSLSSRCLKLFEPHVL